MEFTDERDIGLDERETDYVTAWIRTLAIGMIVLFVVFALFDWYELLPPLPGAAAARAVSVTPQR
jgi:hypothetical protein